jgi:HEAT repeat protein
MEREGMLENGECLAFEDALRSLADERASLSSVVLYALSGPSKAEVQLFASRWPALPVQRRRKVIDLLVESAEANFELDFRGLFRVTLEDEDEEVRRASVEGLWEDEGVRLVLPLVRLLRQDAAMSVRAAAAESLGRFLLLVEMEELDERYGTLIRGALLEAIDSVEEDTDVRRRAIESIAYWGDQCVRDIIAAAYEDLDESMRLSAVFSMGRSVDRFWADIVQKELASATPAMRYEAARACGELELKEAVPQLIHLISDADREVQFAAITALGQIGGKRASRALERCCASADEVIRLVAEDALAELRLGEGQLDFFDYGAAWGGNGQEGDNGLSLDGHQREVR